MAVQATLDFVDLVMQAINQGISPTGKKGPKDAIPGRATFAGVQQNGNSLSGKSSYPPDQGMEFPKGGVRRGVPPEATATSRSVRGPTNAAVVDVGRGSGM